MTEPKRPEPKKAPAPAGAAKLLISAAAVSSTLVGWALLALETRHLAAQPPAPSAKATPVEDPFPPLPKLVDAAAALDAPASTGRGLRQIDRPPAPPPPPLAVTRSSR